MNKIFLILCFLFFVLLSSFHGGNSTLTVSNYVLDTSKNDTVKRDTVGLDTVSIHKILTPEDKFNQKKKGNRAIYMWGDDKKPFKINPYGGILININKVYSHFSRIGKQSRRLQRIFEDEYEQDQVEQMWLPLTVKYSGLKGDSLFCFQMYFLPTSTFLKEATYYEKVAYVTESMRVYRDSTAIIHQRIKLPSVEEIMKK